MKSTRCAGALIVVAAVAALVAVAAPAGAGSSRPAAPSHASGHGGVAARGGVAAAASSAQLSGGASPHGGVVRYAVTKQLCGDAAPGQMACTAIQLVPSARTAPGAKAYVTPAYATGPKGGFTPADLASAYGYNPAAPVSQTVAIVDAYDDPYALQELNAFDAQYGLPAETSTSLRKVNQNGNSSPLPSADAGWAGEIALDLQAVRAVCNHCKILLVEANAPSGANLAAGVNTAARLGANEISNSYGGPENPNAAAAVAAAYDHPGIVITASTGDHGWYDWDFANDGSDGASDNAPNTPSAYPTVVAVGGTALGLNANGTRQEEDVWNENGADDQAGMDPYLGWTGAQGASGGGCSGIYSAPAWQAGASGYANTGCGSKRLAGDVAALADPYTGFDVYSHYSGGWGTTGGTSLSSPLIAAMWALAGGAHGAKYPAQTLYDNLRLRPGSIYDVTIGGNSFCAGDTAANCSAALQAKTDPPTGNPNNLGNGNPFYANGWAGLLDCGYPYNGGSGTIAANTQCNAVGGYDGPSGVGTPQGLNLFRRTNPTIAIGRPAALKLNAAQTWSATNFADPVPGATATHYAWNWGDGTATSTSSASTSHTFTSAGTHKVTLTVTDNLNQTGSSSMTITVGVPPTAVIGGPTSVRINQSYTWTSAKSVDKNTGGSITSRTWKLGNTKVGTATTWSHKFTGTGKKTLTLVIVDNTGLRTTKSITVTVTR